MSRKIDLPAEAQVRAVLADMLAEAAAGGAKPSVLALARRLGLSNATFCGTSAISPPRSATLPVTAWLSPAGRIRGATGPGSWPARTPGCAANGTGWPISWKPPSATCDGSPSTTPNCATTWKQPTTSPVSTPAANHPSESDVKPFAAWSTKTHQGCSRGP